MSTCSQFPPSPQEKNVGKGQSSGGNVTRIPTAIPSVSPGTLHNAIGDAESAKLWSDQDAYRDLLTECFPFDDARALTERVRAFQALRARPEFAVYDLAYRHKIHLYEKALLWAAASMPLAFGQEPDTASALQAIADRGFTYRSEA